MAEIVAGVRPIIRLASSPTAWTLPFIESIATTDGSETTMPWPFTNTSVFAVPRSMAMSRVPERPMEDRRPMVGQGNGRAPFACAGPWVIECHGRDDPGAGASRGHEWTCARGADGPQSQVLVGGSEADRPRVP